MDLSGQNLKRSGKTKDIFSAGQDRAGVTLAYVRSRDDITAGDGARHDVVGGKGAISTTTTSNVFGLLKASGIPVAFREKIDETTFLAELCRMIPLEVVMRRRSLGVSSSSKRFPHIPNEFVFPRLPVEFFLKTTGRRFGELSLPWDDPLIRRAEDKLRLLHPKSPVTEEELWVPMAEVVPWNYAWHGMETIARQVFLTLERAWQILEYELVDLKIEFGLNDHGKLLVADVVDNDSWRLRDRNRVHLDKQAYRDGEVDMEELTRRFRLVAELSGRLTRLPRQRVVLWACSEDDSMTAFYKALGPFEGLLEVQTEVCSMHKKPERGLARLRALEEEVPDCVFIVAVGLSNGAAPVLAAHTTCPVIAVPLGHKESPESVWSSLQMPSKVPCLTALSPANAVEAALRMLGARNPAVYALQRMEVESRLPETLTIPFA